ncbi:MAG: IS982 family transposase [Gammaproteobacteria bacterium]|nr:IS982 family transposase [Gammaproteobacteria bacterium]
MYDHTELFCLIDDFCIRFKPIYLKSLKDSGVIKRCRNAFLELSEIIFLATWFHLSHFKTFKHFIAFVSFYHRKDFKIFPSYQRINALVAQHAQAIAAFFEALLVKPKQDHIHFVDSTPLTVCKNTRISRHRTFRATAGRGKSSTGWFYGFKLHFIVNRACEIVSALVTAGNVSDVSVLFPLFQMHPVQGKMFGDRGYISKLYKQLLSNQHCKMVTRSRANMPQADLSEEEEHYMCQRNLIETVNSQLKDDLGLEHSRHRSWQGYIAHIYASLIAYQCVTIKAQVKSFVGA